MIYISLNTFALYVSMDYTNFIYNNVLIHRSRVVMPTYVSALMTFDGEGGAIKW